MSQEDRDSGLDSSQYDINLVNAEIAQIQREQEQAAAEAAAAVAAQASQDHQLHLHQEGAHHHQQEQEQEHQTEDDVNRYLNSDRSDHHAIENHHHQQPAPQPQQPKPKRKRKVFETQDGIKKCSRCRVKRTDEPEDILEKYATCLNCRTKRKIDNRKTHEENEYLLPSAESTADALTAAMNASRDEQNGNSNLKQELNSNNSHSINDDLHEKKKIRKTERKPSLDTYYKEVARRQRVKDYANLANLYTEYKDFVERIRLNCEHDLFDHHFRGFSDENLIPRYKLDEVTAETFQFVSKKIISLYILPLMDVTGYRFPVRDYHKGGSKSKKITFMFICSQDKTKQRKSRSTDQRKIANRLKVNECDSKINLNYDLCSGFLQINFNHKAHHPYMWKAESVELHKSRNQYLDDANNYDQEQHQDHYNSADILQDPSTDHHHHHHHHHQQQGDDVDDHHHHHHREDNSDNIDLNLIDSIPASSMQYLTGVDEDVAAVVRAQQEREQERQAELDRQAVEDAANQFLQAQARQMKEERGHEEEEEEEEEDLVDQNELDHQQDQEEEQLDDEKSHINVDNIDQELLNMN